MDLYQKTYNLVKQIPRGGVSTYKEIAKALGDASIVRIVGRILNENTELEKIPCYRVVKNDGTTGGYREGVAEKIRKLQNDGFLVKNEKIVNFNRHLFTNFKTDYPLKRLKKEQRQLKKKLLTENDFGKIEIVAGFDSSFKNKKQKAVGVTMQNSNMLTRSTDIQDANFPYIHSYLAFREMNGLKKCYKKLSIKPDLLFVNGAGVLHPRGFGMTSHLGVLLDKPTIGITRSLPCGNLKRTYIYMKGKKKGYMLKRKNMKPLYVSAGHKISLKTAVKYTKQFLKNHALPEPLYLAHKFAKWE